MLPFLETQIASGLPQGQPLAYGAAPGLRGVLRNVGASSCPLSSESRQPQSAGPNWGGAKAPGLPVWMRLPAPPWAQCFGRCFLSLPQSAARPGAQPAAERPVGSQAAVGSRRSRRAWTARSTENCFPQPAPSRVSKHQCQGEARVSPQPLPKRIGPASI